MIRHSREVGRSESSTSHITEADSGRESTNLLENPAHFGRRSHTKSSKRVHQGEPYLSIDQGVANYAYENGLSHVALDALAAPRKLLATEWQKHIPRARTFP